MASTKESASVGRDPATPPAPSIMTLSEFEAVIPESVDALPAPLVTQNSELSTSESISTTTSAAAEGIPFCSNRKVSQWFADDEWNRIPRPRHRACAGGQECPNEYKSILRELEGARLPVPLWSMPASAALHDGVCPRPQTRAVPSISQPAR